MIEEEEYFRVIEDYFLQKRGNPMLLSPKEWALISEWHALGIPREVVLRGIDRAFERREEEERSSTTLRYCRPLVRSEYKRYLKSQTGKTPALQDREQAKDVGTYLRSLFELLEQSSSYARSQDNATLADFLAQEKEKLSREVVEPFLNNQANDLQRVENQLTLLEKEIEQVLLQMISEEQLERIKEETMRELKTFQDKLELPVYQEMLRRGLIKSIRKLYNIPRLSLFYM
ncbi:MAG TPA: hypothetical protein VJ521_13145 [Acidobacteriota bacterium]|nr:hypothetical protein [Acidobacteriota bacterium]